MTQSVEYWTFNTEETGEALGISGRRVNMLVKEGLPKLKRGQFHLPTVIQWFLAKSRKDEPSDINEQRQALYKAQTEKTELENRITRQELLEVDAVQTLIFSLGTLFSTQIQSIEPRLARQFSAEQQDALKAELSAVLETVALEIENIGNTRDTSRDHPAAA